MLKALLRLIALVLKGQQPKRSRAGEVYLPKNRTRLQTGFHWKSPPALPLAAGRGFNVEVVGESYRQPVLEKLVGGLSQYGSVVHVTAQLALPDNMPDHPDAVAVMIEAQHVGFIKAEEAAAMKAELLALEGTRSGVTCRGVIRGGWDDRANGGTKGMFGVELSLARPLRARH